MDEQKIHELKSLISGTVAVAGDEVYEKASKMFVRTIAPSVVVRPQSSKDLAATIRFIGKHAVPFAIRSGGHSNVASRLADGILLLDMGEFASIDVIDAEKKLVRVGAGARWSDVASELEKHNLGISSGDTRTVGVGGLSTGAGIGWMVRKYGPVVDNIVSAEVVTADGTIIEASEETEPDLFWAIRGGGSNFGVVTYFTIKAHTVDGIIEATITYPVHNVGEILKGWRDAMRNAPAELTTTLSTFPSFGEGPATIQIIGCFEGTDRSAADRAFAPFLALGTPIHQEILAKPYKEVLQDALLPPHVRVIVNNTFMKEFTDEAIGAIDEIFQGGATPILQIRHVAGAMNDRPVDATAFSLRDSEVLIVNPTFVSPNASEDEVNAALSPWRAIKPFGQGPYLNLLSEDTGKEITAAYLPATLARLKKIKARYDPNNLFKATYNIPPAE